nr:3-phosphoshikimate 1-carboxyvinyltransferase [Sphingomicrobium nitratireducens]
MPGDKSVSHRALILAAMAEGESRLTGLADNEDVARTRAAVEALGANIVEDGDALQVTGRVWTSPDAPIDCGNSGTTARLLMGACAGVDGLAATLTGDASLSARPMKRVTEPLSRMGARFEGGDTLPITVHGARLGGIDHEGRIPSAQVKSAILLAGLRSGGPVRVVEPFSSRDHTEVMLAQFGVEGAIEEVVKGMAVSLGERRSLTPTDITIPGDPSSAAFLWAAAAVVEGGEVTTPGICVNATRTGFLEALDAMGADVRLDNERLQSGEPVADVTVRHRRLTPIEWGPDHVAATIDELPLLAICAAFAEGETLLEGLGELRVKESDRLGAVAAGLAANGVSVFPTGDALRILGRHRVRGGGTVATAGDHRIAMGFLVLGLAADNPVTIDDGSGIATSFPAFVETMRALGATIEEPA